MAHTSAIETQLEKTILEYLDVLYAVAVKLTKDTTSAEVLVRTTVAEALQAPGTLEGEHPKGALLSLLRRTFLGSHKESLLQGHSQALQPLRSCGVS